MEQEGKYLGTQPWSENKRANWIAVHWESIYVIVKFVEMFCLLTVFAFLITHW